MAHRDISSTHEGGPPCTGSDREVAIRAFAERFDRLFAYVDEHGDDDLSVEVLSTIAGISRSHFQRQFSRLFGLGIHQYVALVRLRRASFQLAFRNHRILDIALDAGYSSHEAFTRAFENSVGQLPSEFRNAPDWDTWFSVLDRLKSIRVQQPASLSIDDMRLVPFSGARVAMMEHRGDPQQLPITLRRFIEWRRSAGVSLKNATYNVAFDDPDLVERKDFRFDIGVAVDRLPSGAERAGVLEKPIPAGRCATFRHVGIEDALWRKVRELYSIWLPASGESVRDFPLFLQRVRFFPDVPERESVTDVFLPIR